VLRATLMASTASMNTTKRTGENLNIYIISLRILCMYILMSIYVCVLKYGTHQGTQRTFSARLDLFEKHSKWNDKVC
jgi:hypothetical protein